MSEEAEKKEGEGAEAAKPKSKKKLIIIIVVVLLVLGGAGAFFLLGGKKEEAEGALEEHAESHSEEKHYATAELEPFIVNLSENASFVKTKIMLEYDPAILEKAEHAHAEGGAAEGGGHGEAKGGGGLPGMLAGREPMIRDSIIRVLSSKTTDELLNNEGKERLKEELIEAINEAIALDEGPAVGIYFTEFIIQ